MEGKIYNASEENQSTFVNFKLLNKWKVNFTISVRKPIDTC